jgi:hypothetical protein
VITNPEQMYTRLAKRVAAATPRLDHNHAWFETDKLELIHEMKTTCNRESPFALQRKGRKGDLNAELQDMISDWTPLLSSFEVQNKEAYEGPHV